MERQSFGRASRYGRDLFWLDHPLRNRAHAYDEPVAEKGRVAAGVFLWQPVPDVFDLTGVDGRNLEMRVKEIRVRDVESDSMILGELFFPAFGNHIDLSGEML